MKKLFAAFWLYRNAVMVGAIIFGLLGTTGYFYLKGRSDCRKSAEIKAANEALNLREDLNEIRNNRPDAAGVVKRLRRGTF